MIGELFELILDIVCEVVSMTASTSRDVVSETVGCLGGCTIYALTASRVNLENDDWRAQLTGWITLVIILGGLAWLGHWLFTPTR